MIKYFFLFLFFCNQSFALEKWVIDDSKSLINFSIPVLFTEDIKGNFKRFKGIVNADRKNSKGVVNIEVDIESMTTNYDLDYADLIKGDTFFNVVKFPIASIKTKDFIINKKDNTANAFVTLNIKGKEKDYKIPLSYNLEGKDKATAKGSFNFNRSDFEIGTGVWSSTLVLKDEVTINVSLSLDKVK